MLFEFLFDSKSPLRFSATRLVKPRRNLKINAAVLSLNLFFCLSVITVYADTTITLDLPLSQAGQDAQAARKAADSQRARTSVQPRGSAPSRRGFTPSRGGVTRESVVGRLGQLTQSTSIFRRRSYSSSQLTQAPAGTYLAIQQDAGAWIGVLMADGSTGWLSRDRVQMMDYQVVSSGKIPNYANMGDGDIYPRSNSPYFNGNPAILFQEAYKYLGVRYVWGGNTANGIDCSGFIKNVFGSCGYPLPRLGSDQMAYGIPVPPSQLQPGDRLYFGRRKERLGVTHTGLYIGNGYFIHSSSSRHGVAISSLSEAMFARIFVCARR